MLMILLSIVCVEVIILLSILIVYWLDYTYSYINCHCRTEPCPERTAYEKFKSEFGWIKSKDCNELEQFKNLADDYNIPFDSFYDVIEKLLTEE